MSDHANAPSANRRDVLTSAAIAAATAAASAAATVATPAQAQPTALPAAGLGGAPTSKIFWQVATTSGVVEGIANGNVKEFKGIPYGASTAGANRYAPPKKPVPWKGVRSAIGYGPISPQTPSNLASDYSMMIGWDRHVGPGGMGEDCLNLNVWTPSVNDGARRPVLVSYHGGGWTTGSGNGPMYDGAQLARLNDVVVVTVNHRLAANGYVHLGAFHPDFAYAGNCGVMDMVASLEWVRDNIEKFGGDPKRVMIFGQSGGGSKTSTMLAVPSAKGLFSRAAIQSGSTLRQATADQAAQDAEKFLKACGLTTKTVADVRKLSWQQILEAQGKSGAGFRPVVDGKVLPHHPFDPTAPAESRDVPVIISTTLHDAALRLTNFDLTWDQANAVFTQRFGPKGPQLLAAYRQRNPKLTPFLAQAEAFTDQTRGNSMRQAERKAALGGAPAYMYVWDWATPAFGGKFGAVHGHDVDATFHLYRNAMCGSGVAEGHTMADRAAATWAAFAATGNPNNPMIPSWAPYDAKTRATMVFDSNMRVVNDYRGDMVKMIAEATANRANA